jgi:hypothetical protein
MQKIIQKKRLITEDSGWTFDKTSGLNIDMAMYPHEGTKTHTENPDEQTK